VKYNVVRKYESTSVLSKVLSYLLFFRKYESTFESTFTFESTTLYLATKVRKYFRSF
jgi:hypothetical protein